METIMIFRPWVHYTLKQVSFLPKATILYQGLGISSTNRTVSFADIKKTNIYNDFSKDILTYNTVNIRKLAELISSVVVRALQKYLDCYTTDT